MLRVVVLYFAALVCLLRAAGPSVAAPEDLVPPQIKPVAERTIDFKEPMRSILSIVPADEEQVALLIKFAFSPDADCGFCDFRPLCPRHHGQDVPV